MNKKKIPIRYIDFYLMKRPARIFPKISEEYYITVIDPTKHLKKQQINENDEIILTGHLPLAYKHVYDSYWRNEKRSIEEFFCQMVIVEVDFVGAHDKQVERKILFPIHASDEQIRAEIQIIYKGIKEINYFFRLSLTDLY
ncbi:MAG: hypothetical protein ACK5NA_08740 [Enterococcus sp.]